ncbi:hypothetical protein [Duganella levis]|uniref:Uncharacterized protein n=1 Tax=Duganella levis TaxID=2692169 RepID=A0ABW9W9A1_9BURK|nr:hypothetical protein [Duganella levis]MYN30558.1 hypothetical protein [Duganella levis]
MKFNPKSRGQPPPAGLTPSAVNPHEYSLSGVFEIIFDFFQKTPKVPSITAVTSFKMRRKPCIANPAVGAKKFKNISQKP